MVTADSLGQHVGHLSANQGVVKLHVGLDADGYLPTFTSLSEGKAHESNWANTLKLPHGSFVVFDHSFNDYVWYQSLMKDSVVFVTRLKSNAVVAHDPKRSGRKAHCRPVPGALAARAVFQWIKQKLKAKTFLGTSKNAGLIQIWIALRVYLLLAFLKFKARIDLAMQQILRLLQLNLFDRRDLLALLKPPEIQLVQSRQFSLFQQL